MPSKSVRFLEQYAPHFESAAECLGHVFVARKEEPTLEQCGRAPERQRSIPAILGVSNQRRSFHRLPCCFQDTSDILLSSGQSQSFSSVAVGDTALISRLPAMPLKDEALGKCAASQVAKHGGDTIPLDFGDCQSRLWKRVSQRAKSDLREQFDHTSELLDTEIVQAKVWQSLEPTPVFDQEPFATKPVAGVNLANEREVEVVPRLDFGKLLSNKFAASVVSVEPQQSAEVVARLKAAKRGAAAIPKLELGSLPILASGHVLENVQQESPNSEDLPLRKQTPVEFCISTPRTVEEELHHLRGELMQQFQQEQANEQLCEQLIGDMSALRLQVQRGDLKLVAMSAELREQQEINAALKVQHSEESATAWVEVRKRDAELAAMRSRSERELRSKTEQTRRLEDAEAFARLLVRAMGTPTLAKRFDLDAMDVLGRGSRGVVVTCTSRSSGQRFALKLIDQRKVASAAREWGHGSGCSHPNVMQYMQVVVHDDESWKIRRRLQAAFAGAVPGTKPIALPSRYVCIVTEFMDGGTMQRFAETGQLVAESSGAIARQIASALAYLHRARRTHNDVSPANVFLCSAPGAAHFVAKLGDFGSALHSADRGRDSELLAYSLWCTSLGCTFDRCPRAGRQRHTAVETFRSSPAAQSSPRHWQTLADIIDGMWHGSLSMAQVECLDQLQDLVICPARTCTRTGLPARACMLPKSVPQLPSCDLAAMTPCKIVAEDKKTSAKGGSEMRGPNRAPKKVGAKGGS